MNLMHFIQSHGLEVAAAGWLYSLIVTELPAPAPAQVVYGTVYRVLQAINANRKLAMQRLGVK